MKVLIVDDHTLVRRGLAHVVKECFPEAEVAEAGSADEAEAILEETRIDVAQVVARSVGAERRAEDAEPATAGTPD